uniref:Galaxin-like repeats domain-containing protein n=1 Tax=Romanomermis culicivorax TaxID=13658 RepID=A0A915JQ52_ROMCU
MGAEETSAKMRHQKVVSNCSQMTFSETCNSRSYDPDKFLCCDDFQLCRKGERARCCGKFCYDIGVSLCCGNDTTNLIDKCHVWNSACCGQTKCYNNRTQMCCNGEVVDGGGCDVSSTNTLEDCCRRRRNTMKFFLVMSCKLVNITKFVKNSKLDVERC